MGKGKKPKPLLMSRIVIERKLHGDGSDIVWVQDDDALSLVEVLGLLAYAQDTIIRSRMDKGHDQDAAQED